MSKHNFFQDSFNSAIKWIKVRLLNKYVVCDDFVYVGRGGGEGRGGGFCIQIYPFSNAAIYPFSNSGWCFYRWRIF